MRSTSIRRTGAGVAAVLLVGSVLAGCVESERDGKDNTFVFAASAAPKTLDPFYASDGETFRVTRQIYEGLVGTEPGTVEPAPLLAESWTQSDDGLSYTFDLKDGVTFHDGTPFDAEAVCANFERWAATPEVNQTDDKAYYYGKLFRGFATGPAAESAIYGGCSADDELTATITLDAPFAGFIAAMSLPAFAMQSPAALEEYQDDASPSVLTSAYGTEHPTGTGPFELTSWNQGSGEVRLAPYDDYWGEAAKVDEVVIVEIDTARGRAEALRNGEIDGFDLVGPADVESLAEDGFTIENRPAFNILYLAFNQAQAPFDDVRVRQAIAHAIDKEAVISASMPDGTEPADQFVPELVDGYAADVPTYEYDPELARQLLEEAGVAGTTITFDYPTNISRPYMPQPDDTFNIVRSQLEAVGLTVEPVAAEWTDYLEQVQNTPDHGIHLLGWTGDYDDPDNFLGVFFGQQSLEWGFDNAELFAEVAAPRALTTTDEQRPLYEQVNRDVMEFLPGVPLASPVPSLAFAENVEGYEASPVQDEVWNMVEIAD
ncbi:ABC transporter substrate-binding protein [Nocardioides zeae]|uniref:Peptide/nickel transport system substrate-binding protein n=1 Tax=Nocardioides zeae TaxID=1457234 RepID=A0AAJ1X0S7_9ACTN|nr:ABC transporter substrate-binding protein [Nocardioides zeae]MDQ1104166.1 peptide/nickel transport system substrate-binding protein [Nocardioides zeae]